MKKKTLALFSGGKDSMYAIQWALDRDDLDLIASIKNADGSAHFHAGPEADNLLRQTQLRLMGLPFREVETREKNYMRDAFLGLKEIVNLENIGQMITGDLWLPYTRGAGDMLAGVLGIEVLRPCRDLCPSKAEAQKYMQQVLDSGIESIVYSVRKGKLPRSFIGRAINQTFLEEMARRNVDAAGERSEYQSLVMTSPVMNGRIVIDSFDTHYVPGRGENDHFFRMLLKKHHVEEK